MPTAWPYRFIAGEETYDTLNSACAGMILYREGYKEKCWLDNVNQGAKAVSKDVYQESAAGLWADNVVTDVAGSGADAVTINSPSDANGANVYYFDQTYGTMAKGDVEIDGQTYHFNEDTGVTE